jgi:hypothetical protein
VQKPSAAMIVGLVGLFVGLSGVGIAANGQSLILGKADNSATLKTGLSAPIDDRALQVTNTNTGTSATALGLKVAAGHPPLFVNSEAGKATNLNADKLDGIDSTGFLPKAGKAADADKLDGIDSTGFLSKVGKAADADKLDGIDSTGFLPLSGKAADADRLDGIDSSELTRVARGAVGTFNSSASFIEETSVSLTAPAAGFVLLVGTLSVDTLSGGDKSCNPCEARVQLRNKSTEETSNQAIATFGNGTSEQATALTQTWVFPVQAGQVSFALDVNVSGSAGVIFPDNPTLTALYSRFGSTGSGTLGATLMPGGTPRSG